MPFPLVTFWLYYLSCGFPDWPDSETFEENLTVHGVDKIPLKFKLPDISDMEIVGVEEVKEEFVSFPPFADIKDLLKPM